MRKLKKIPTLKIIFAYGGYRREIIENVKSRFGYLLHIVLRTDKQKKFEVLPKRWIIERTFTWFEITRRLGKGYEYLLNTSEAVFQLASIKTLIK